MATTTMSLNHSYANMSTTTAAPSGNSLIYHPHWSQFPPIPDYWHYIIGVYITFVGITGVTGNTLVIWIFSSYSVDGKEKTNRWMAMMMTVPLGQLLPKGGKLKETGSVCS